MRWEVFKQDTPKKAHQAVGSVHGADAEHALLNARHVFGRRPAAVSMWVVRADRIYSRTAEELAAESSAGADGTDTPPATGTGPRTYLVFRKSSHRRSMTFVDHVAEVEASHPRDALVSAMSRSADGEGLAWWVIEEGDVHRSDPDAAESWFEPALDKTYKQQSQYGTVAPGAGKRSAS